MFARLYTNSGDVKTAYSELSKVITGAITSPASLTAFNSSTSTIDATQPSNWVEYTSVGSTNSVNAGTAIWFRQRNRVGRWKYACIYRTTSPINTHKGLLRHYTAESPSVVASVAGVATNNSEAYGATTEYTVAAGPGYLIVATRLTTAAHFTEAHMWLEYPETGNSAFLTLPNHVLYRHFTTGGSYATDATTDIAYSTGIVEVAKAGNADVAVYNGGMSTPATMHGTMKPSYFTSLGNTLSGSSSFVSYPFFNLFYVSSYQGHLDCSNLTNVWGTGPTLAVPNPAAPSGMSLLTCATNAIEDLSANGFAITATGNTAVTSFSPSNLNVDWSYYFDGGSGFVSFPTSNAFNFGSGNFTIEFWFKRTGTNQSYARYFQTANGDVFTGISISQNLNTQNQVLISMSSTGTSWDIISSAVTLIDLQWNHCALVRNGNTFKFYVNGTEALSFSSSASLHHNAANTCIIGGQTGRSTSGYISNFRIVKGTAIYTGNFTPPTVSFAPASLPAGTSLLTCASNTFSDLSSNNITITKGGNAYPVALSPFAVSGGWSNFFDGSGDYFTVPSNAAFQFGSGDFTVECWTFIKAFGSDGTWFVGPWGSVGGTNRGWDFAYAPVLSGVVFGYSTTGTNSLFITSSQTPVLNTWNHYAAVRSGSTLTLYQNGIAVGAGNVSGVTIYPSTNPVWVGSNPENGGANNFAMNGYISNLRIVKGTALYTSNFTPTTTNLPGALLTTAYGDSVTVNGTDYAFLKANGSLSYLVPKR